MSSEKSFLKNIIALLLPYRFYLSLIFLYMILGALLNVALPIVNMKILDEWIIALNFPSLVQFSVVSLVLYLASRGLDFLEFKRLTSISKKFELKLSKEAHDHLFRLPINYFKEHNESQIMSNLNYDIGKITRILDRPMFLSVAQIFNVIGGIIGLCIIDMRLLGLVILIIPIKVFVMRFFAKRREGLFAKAIPLLNNVAAWLGDTVGNIDVVKLWNLQSKKTSEYVKLKEAALNANIETQYNDKVSENIDYAVNFIFDLLIYIVGFGEIVRGCLTVGGLTAFASFSTQVINPISFVMQIRFYFSEIKPSIKRHAEFLELQEEDDVDSQQEKIQSPNKITFDHVSLKLSDTTIISDISLELKRGQMVAITGENGSGKSSLVNLLLRFYLPTEGKICFDGINIQDFSLKKYRDLFAVIRQDTKLFNLTIRENIDPLGKKSDEDIHELCNAWKFTQLIESLPEGFGTIVGKNGSKLSGGEGQKISAIRALLKDANILVIDEATSNYDVESEDIFNDFLSVCDSYDYIIIITHRNKILEKVDRIIQLENGVVISDRIVQQDAAK